MPVRMGYPEILYAFTSTTANNGSAFAGLTGSTYYYNTTLGLASTHRTLCDARADARIGRLPLAERNWWSLNQRGRSP